MQTEINKLVNQSFTNGKADEAFINMVTSSLKKLNLTESLQTLNLYLKGLKRKIVENTLTVESAVTLSSTEINSVKKMLNREVFAVEQKINSSLLGGLRLRIGDETIDFSLKSKINQVKERIIE